METVTRRSGGKFSKLFRVLVAGGIALAAGCATSGSATRPEKPDDGTASTPPASAPAEPGGVRGW